MADYRLNTKSSWSKTTIELEQEFEKWGVTDWETNYPKGARSESFTQPEQDRTVSLRYVLRGKTVNLSMGNQSRAVDNLRVLYLCVQDMRMNERRGLSELIEQSYLQLAAPAGERDPYEVLMVLPDTAIEICEAVYRTMSAKYHPDSKPNGDAEIFKELTRAIEKIRGKK